MRITALVSAIVLMAASSAQAVFVGFDVGANNTPAGANALISDDGDFNNPTCSLSADVGLGSLAAGDVDFYSVFVPEGCIVTAITTPLTPFGNVPDTLLGAFDPGLALLAGSDDAGSDGNSAGPVRGSAVRFLSLVTGTYYLGVSGFPDFGFTGDHSEGGDYLLTVSITPEPSTLGLLAIGALALIRRRK
ncbi:MAG: hypothetical protein DCC65_01285 [Planctomycetota bacterium]|nr:MAG: hypothetical protein DCC65_01285 [Planctomycetota bacterium]